MHPISRHFKFRFLVFEVVLTKLRMRVFKSILISQVKKNNDVIILDDEEEASPAKVSWGNSFEDETANAIKEDAEEEQSSGFYDVYIEAEDENV